jgi:hypothetical protein
VITLFEVHDVWPRPYYRRTRRRAKRSIGELPMLMGWIAHCNGKRIEALYSEILNLGPQFSTPG